MEPIVSSYKHILDIKQDAAVARKLGVEKTALSNYKKGIRKMPDKALAEIADGLKMPLDDLIAAANIGLATNSEEEKEFWFSRVKDERLKKLAQTYVHPPIQKHIESAAKS
jgi:transcriptional regulator with XRE-family HTH domain